VPAILQSVSTAGYESSEQDRHVVEQQIRALRPTETRPIDHEVLERGCVLNRILSQNKPTAVMVKDVETEMTQAFYEHVLYRNGEFKRLFYNAVGLPHLDDSNHMEKNLITGVSRQEPALATEIERVAAVDVTEREGQSAEERQSEVAAGSLALDAGVMLAVAHAKKEQFQEVVSVLLGESGAHSY